MQILSANSSILTQQNAFSVKILHEHTQTQARVTEITTPHGKFLTPAFMPVGTRAAVNCMNPQELCQTGSQIILGGNTYHMLIAPGLEIIEAIGGMHKFMNWPYPMLTDSGGFQIFSLSRQSQLCRINEEGARFKHPDTGQVTHMTPKSAIMAQKVIGADIIMAFDQCTAEDGGYDLAVKAMNRTHRWLLESLETHMANPNSSYGKAQALFGIIQGGRFQELREKSAEFIMKLPVDGIAIGGETVGYDMEKTAAILQWLQPYLLTHKTRYTMGVGLRPQDLLDVVKYGIDIFDCVAPTRNARHGSLYHGYVIPNENWLSFVSEEPKGHILIKKSIYARDESPILEGCDCYTCQQYSRAYLHYLFKQKQNLYLSLACCHNIRVMQKTCEIMREKIQSEKR